MKEKPDKPMDPKKDFRSRKTPVNFAYVIMAVFGVLYLHSLFLSAFSAKPLPYSEFLALLKAGKVEEVTVSPNRIDGNLLEEQDGWSRFSTNRVDGDLAATLDEYGVKYSGRLEGNWLTNLLSWILPALLFLGIWFFLIRRVMRGAGGGGLMAIGKSKAKVYVESDTKVSFEDVAGL